MSCDGLRVKTVTDYEIDMLFDADNGTLEMGVLDEKIVQNDKTTHKLTNIPKNKGFVPHFQIYRDTTAVQVAQIDPFLFLQKNAFVSQLFDKSKVD